MSSSSIVIVVVLLGLILTSSTFRLVQQYERGVVLRFGRLLPAVREPGLRAIVPVADRMRKVSIQTVVLDIPSQGTITRDNVTIGVDAVVYFRVDDPVRAVINVENYVQATSQVAQTSLRSVIGRSDLDTLLSDRARINAELRDVIDAPTEEWGIVVERVEIKDISLPESMRRSMSRQAEAERDRRARVIAADGELQASGKLSEAAGTMSDTPGALQLRLLQTVTDVAAEKNSTLVMPFPVELLRFFEHATGGAGARPVPARPPRPSGRTATVPPSRWRRCPTSPSPGRPRSRSRQPCRSRPPSRSPWTCRSRRRSPQTAGQILGEPRQLVASDGRVGRGHPLVVLGQAEPAVLEGAGQPLDHQRALPVGGADPAALRVHPPAVPSSSALSREPTSRRAPGPGTTPGRDGPRAARSSRTALDRTVRSTSCARPAARPRPGS